MNVYLLFHERDLDGSDDIKLIGAYQSEPEAEAAKARACALPGFSDHRGGFSISRYEVGADHWTTGFVTVRSTSDEHADAEQAA